MERSTRQRIVDAATSLFYLDSVAGVGVDLIAERAKLTKKTLYYHFKSKDALVAAYLEDRDEIVLSGFKEAYAGAQGDAAEKIGAMLAAMGKDARSRRWSGCGFLRAAAELATKASHPAPPIAAAHKKRFEHWMRDVLAAEGIPGAPAVARSVAMLVAGAQTLALLHRDPSYFTTAGHAAQALIRSAMGRAAGPSAKRAGAAPAAGGGSPVPR